MRLSVKTQDLLIHAGAAYVGVGLVWIFAAFPHPEWVEWLFLPVTLLLLLGWALITWTTGAGAELRWGPGA